MVIDRFLEWLRTYKEKQKPIAAISVIELLIVFSPLLLWLFFSLAPHSASGPSGLVSSSTSLPLYLQGLDFREPETSTPQRPLFPYSVIPRGVTSARELVTALHGDPVAASHYSGFHIASAHLVRIPKDRTAYVSYRLGNKIYWTSKKVTLHAGETFLSDGTHLARTRCGNRVSEVPAEPTSPSEPPNPVLNTPVGPRLPEISPEPRPDAPIWSGSKILRRP